MENKEILNEEILKDINGGVVLTTTSGTIDEQVEALFDSGMKVLVTMAHNSLYAVGNEPQNKLYSIKKAVMYGDFEKAKIECDHFREYMIYIDCGGLLNKRPFKEILDMFG